ncbi:hypothetical protein KKE34_03360, partial [Patescibacteria group bacterium]|nr:hypothetical protein [Patescibacteria group bacterium]MBU1885625.1 hypothetical protein [Patescibacteria group bacterium]
ANQGIQACQADPGSFACAGFITGVQMGVLDDVAQAADDVITQGYDDAGRYVNNAFSFADEAQWGLGSGPQTTLAQRNPLLDEIVQLTEDIYQNQSLLYSGELTPQGPGCRTLSCGLSSDINYYSAQAYGVSAETYQLQNVQASRGLVETASQGSFRHAFSVVDTGETLYLADNTFGQFINPETFSVQQIAGTEGIDQILIGDIADLNDPIVNDLMQLGYFELTEANFRRYLDITSTTPVPQGVSALEALNITSSLKIDIQPDEIIPWWPANP